MSNPDSKLSRTSEIDRLTDHRESEASGESAIAEYFQDMVRRLRVRFPIDRAVLILGTPVGTDYVATAVFANGCLRNLAMRLSGESSLLRQVAEGGATYTESFCGFFSGTDLERSLLLDNSAEAYAIVPLKHDGRVVGLIGLSSHEPCAFSIFEDGVLGEAGVSLGRQIALGAGSGRGLLQ